MTKWHRKEKLGIVRKLSIRYTRSTKTIPRNSNLNLKVKLIDENPSSIGTYNKFVGIIISNS